MKARACFVSNSSSSSFVVVLRDENGNATNVTPEQEQILLAYGFKYINAYWRHALVNGAEKHDSKDGFDSQNSIAMTYDVVCNQDEVMEFLFEHKIPFVESEEYDTQTVHYDGEHDYYDTYVNAGNSFLIYGLHNKVMDDMNRSRLCNAKPFYRTRISDNKDITDTLIGDGQ